MSKTNIGKKAKVKDQFVLSVGDDGAILCLYRGGKLENRIFLDSPLSDDAKLIEKLFLTYSHAPISILVDVIEQTYSQQVLPPVSALGIKQQIQRRIKRDFQPNDLSNVLPLGRSKDGRKDWNFLFISLANTDPFAKWLELVLQQKNRFDGVYLLPVEAVTIAHNLNKISTTAEDKIFEWELLILHNKVGGFRIIAVKSGKLVFTRLAQNLVGDNIPDIIVGNLEQEIANTVEYLKRLAFKGEAECKITIITSAEVIQKIDPQTMKFGKIQLLTPHDAAEKLKLPVATTEKDKFADVFSSAYFASHPKHVLKFNSTYTKKIENLYNGIKGSFAFAGLVSVLLTALSVSELSDVLDLRMQNANMENELLASEAKLRDVQNKEAKLPADYKKMQEILEISKILPKDKYFAYNVIASITDIFNAPRSDNSRYLISSIQFTRDIQKNTQTAESQIVSSAPQTPDKFEITINFDLIIPESEQDRLENYIVKFDADIKAALPKYTVVLTQPPKADVTNKFEQVNSINGDSSETKTLELPGSFKITGVVGET